MQAGVDGLLRDKTRPSRIPPLGQEVTARAVALTLAEPPGETTHWTAAAMARASGISVSSVQRIWRSHGLQPHRVRQFKLSNDPQFAAKLHDIVGLYVDPPTHAVVLSLDEKSQIQALDRTQPGLPLKKGRCGTMTHDYKRHGTTTLFAALNVLDGTVIGRCMQRHRHQEFIRFLNAVEAEVPAGKLIHVILDNYAAHKHPKVMQCLARHPRWTFHFNPTSASWITLHFGDDAGAVGGAGAGDCVQVAEGGGVNAGVVAARHPAATHLFGPAAREAAGTVVEVPVERLDELQALRRLKTDGLHVLERPGRRQSALTG